MVILKLCALSEKTWWKLVWIKCFMHAGWNLWQLQLSATKGKKLIAFFMFVYLIKTIIKFRGYWFFLLILRSFYFLIVKFFSYFLINDLKSTILRWIFTKNQTCQSSGALRGAGWENLGDVGVRLWPILQAWRHRGGEDTHEHHWPRTSNRRMEGPGKCWPRGGAAQNHTD